MTRAPLIGLTMSFTAGAETPRAHLNATYVRAVQSAGGVPVPLPPYLDDGALEVLASRLDALLLTGGGDVDPARYGEPAHPSVVEVSPERDALEIALRPVAWAPDGVIEGLESGDTGAFVVGVQWHPEELVSTDPAARRLFVALVEAARRS